MNPDLSRRALLTTAVSAAAIVAAPAAFAQAASYVVPGSVGEVSRFLKRNDFVRKAAGLSDAEFARRWLGVNGPLLGRVSGLQKCIFNLVDHTRSPGIDFDGVAELFFHDEQAYAGALSDGSLGAAAGDAESDIMAPDRMRLFTREVVIRDFDGPQPPGAVKRLGLVRRATSLTHDAFVKDWRDVHAPEANAMPGLIRYTLNVADPNLSPDADRDGYAELWWKDQATYDADAAQRARDRAALAAKGAFFPTQPSLLMIVEPHQVL